MSSERLCVALLTLVTGAIAADLSPAPVSFHKDVLPVLQRHCQTCHRPGQAGPMSFLTYESTRPWAKAIKEAVVMRKMPPWFADPNVGHFLNDPSLKQADIDTLVKWADIGAPQGNAKDAPPPVQWPEGWQIKPDVIVEGPSYDVPAHPKNNVIEWVAVTVPTGFTGDTWITSVEIKPDHPEVTHHICLGFNPHTPDVKYSVPEWTDKDRDAEGSAIPGKGPTFTSAPKQNPGIRDGEDCYLPGNVATDYRPLHAAKLIPAGSDIRLNLHYTPNGKAVTDHVRIGFTLAKEPPQRRYVSLGASSPRDAKRFAIPPNDPNWQSPPGVVTFAQDVELVFMMPHMHSRGKDMTWTLEYPDGTKLVVLNVPHYDFNWQLGYQTSVQVPKGTRLRVDAHFDNSVNNKFNPNPNRFVYYGEMTWEEMMAAFFGVVVDKDADPEKILEKRPQQASGA
jgi:hypothetical protein